MNDNLICDKDCIKDLRPYEKCIALGEQSLTDTELIAAIIKTGVSGKPAGELAKDILDEVCETTGRQRRKVIRRDQLYLMHHADVPVTIVEVGYMTNRSDMRYLKKQKNQREIAQGIYNGLCKSLQRIEK